MQKYDGLENIEKRSRALEVTLGSNLENLEKRMGKYFRIAFSRKVVDPDSF
jgi:hypothetical protein